MIKTEDLYHCENCHAYFYKERVNGKRGDPLIECIKCGHRKAFKWPDIPEGYGRKNEWPDMWTAYCE